MKKLIVFCTSLFIFASCDINDDSTNFRFDFLPVKSVEVPDEFELGETYPIKVSYYKPTSCHAFKELYYLQKNNELIIAPITYVIEDNTCETLEDEIAEAAFNFRVTSNGSYIFKFWQGEDSEGEDQYLTIEVPVVE